MTHPNTPPRTTRTSKSQMRCFQCRKSFQMKEGDWKNWKTMQVFLCRPCDIATQARPERREAGASARLASL